MLELDANHDGELSLSELAAVAHEVGVEIGGEALHRLFATIDEDHSGKVTSQTPVGSLGIADSMSTASAQTCRDSKMTALAESFSDGA